MASPSNTNKTYYDILSSFELGVNSGVSPNLLPKNQLAWGINTTVRGGHASTRPPFQKQTLDYAGDTTLQTLVETGYFQGAGVYRPDFGASQIIAQINGHIICFTPTGSTWAVTDVSIAGDLNVVGTTPVWMWQSEKWMIISDGTGTLPVFYDGVSSRRSNGPAVTLGQVDAGVPANFPNPRVIGETIQVTLAANWENPVGTAGPFNVPVIFNGAFYQTKEAASSGYSVDLTNVSATAGATVPANTAIVVDPQRVGTIQTVLDIQPNIGFSCGPGRHVYNHYARFTLLESDAAALSVGMYLTTTQLAGPSTGIISFWRVLTISTPSGGIVTIEVETGAVCDLDSMLPIYSLVAGTTVSVTGATPSYVVGTTIASFIVPAVGGTVTTTINLAYTGLAGQKVWIGSEAYYISASAVPAPSTTLYLVNLSDTTDAGDAVPTGAVNGLITSVPEIAACRIGAYGMGRNWYSLTDGISYAAGDIVGGASGTQANNYRDSVLTTTENDFLSGGGTFRLPSSGNTITSMTFTANIDTSMGQGPLQIGTDSGFFSNLSPVDRTDWAAMTSPLQTESLIGQGPLSQWSTILANSDILFRSIEGLGSLIIARRNFGGEQAWSNAPISREVERALENDQKSLLPYSSAVNFDNRYLITCYPAVSNVGVFNQGLVSLNFDLMSNLRGKAPPVYDGMWTGLNFIQALTGNFSGSGRAFAFAFNPVDEIIELYELLRANDGHFDNGDTRIAWVLETPCLFREDIKPKSELIRLLDAEIEVKDVDGLVDFEVQYKPDYYPCWTTWRSFQICANQTTDNSKPGYRTRMSLGDPTGDACEENNNRPLHTGHFFQFRINITGYCKFMGMRVQATTQPEADFAPPICAPVTSDTIPAP